jgi:hypothetical protein
MYMPCGYEFGAAESYFVDNDHVLSGFMDDWN